jgi:soluble lytic murein transglycosylase
MTQRCWDPIIPARWLNPVARLAALVGVAVVVADAQTLETLARAFHDTPSAKTRAALERFAEAHPTGVDGALANLALGVAAVDDGDGPTALRHLVSAKPKLPALSDYIGFWLASAHEKTKNPLALGEALKPVWTADPVSPVTGKAAVLEARSLIDQSEPRPALTVLTRYAELLPQPQASLLQAEALDTAGDRAAAAAWYQTVYCGSPLSPEALEAFRSLKQLELDLGPRFPPALPQARLDRASKLLEARQYSQARGEFTAMASELTGTERDVARVRIGVADYMAKRTQVALSYLETLSIVAPEADAERLYYIAAALERLDRDPEIQSVLGQIAAKYPASPWRLKALLLAAYPFLLDNNASGYVPIYQACTDAFPDSSEAAGCHWHLTFNAWMARKPESAALLREHVRRYPASEKANAALYFLGRLSEQSRDLASAKRFYREISERFPNTYYGVQSRTRLAAPEIASAGLTSEADTFLRSLPPVKATNADFEPNAAAAKRIVRARLLERAALDYWADGELRFGARRGDSEPFVMATELAEQATRRGAVPVALRHIKGTANGYLSLPLDAAPVRFWKLAFPMPYRTSIEEQARENGLDPFLLAALIRQESEFDPKVVSYARAIGLTQVMPATGRELSRKLGIRNYRTDRLKDAETNLRLGSYYLKEIFDAFNGRVEPSLAAYNAGKSRADRWLGWAGYREPAEFVESIPFQQTREYVQILIRNADVYRRLYENEPAQIAAAPQPAAKEEPSGKPKAASSRKPPARR